MRIPECPRWTPALHDDGVSRGGSIRKSPAGPQTICLLALSVIADDPRVRRQGDAFHRAGWQVVGVGLAGARSPDPEWPVLTVGRFERARPKSRLFRKALTALRLLYVRIRPRAAQRLYWSASEQIRGLAACAERVTATVWLANDWNTLPLAARLACEKGGVYGYDTHEFAAEEYGGSAWWRFWHRPIVCALEEHFIRGATVVSAVSAGIAACLDQRYRLPRAPIVVRNTASFQAIAFRPTGERIRVLYHGIVAPGRGLEAAIDSVALWRPEFDLTLRGPGKAEFLGRLQQRIAARGLQHRVRLAPPVPMIALVSEAAGFDIGLFALPGGSQHNELALPNKLFEYAMAGLAVCVSALPEMAGLVREFDFGTTIAAIEPAAISAAINRFDRELVDRYRRNALAAARELCWERESERLTAAYGAAWCGAPA